MCAAVSNYMIIAYKANNWNHVFFFNPQKAAYSITLKISTDSAVVCEKEWGLQGLAIERTHAETSLAWSQISFAPNTHLH